MLLGLGVLLCTVSTSAQAPKLVLNGYPLKVPTLIQDGKTLVALHETARRLGMDVIRDEERVELRWGLGRSRPLTSEELHARGPALYIELEKLAQIAEIRLLKLGSEYHLWSTPARLRSVRALSNQSVIFSFDARVPFELQLKSQPVTIRFFHVQSPSQGEGWGEGVKFSPDDPGVLRAQLPHAIASWQATVIESEREFSIWLRPAIAERPAELPRALLRTETQTRIHDDILYLHARAVTLAGPVSLRYLKISRWRERYRLVALLPPDGIGSLAPLDHLASQALAAINANFFDPQSQLPIGLLIKDGVLHSAPYGQRGALAITLFGELEFVAPKLALSAYLLGQRVAIDGVNRPPQANKLFLYTNRYALPIRSELPLKAVRLRGNVVVGVSENSIVLPDGESTLLVATGAARSRLGGVRPGERIEIVQALEPSLPFVREAISAGPVLLRDGQIVLDPKAESFSDEFARALAARSVFAITESDELLFVTVVKDGTSVGADLQTLAALMKALGARDALALDGGSSSALLFRQGPQITLIGSRRPIAAALALIPR
ncbi:MAG: phosphodiester glycosidase family protein [Candidatus Bipolaricaulota bacterium]|nr:phosphodiester glycosidase family protein [Candidatus Bipolaricaulota bacterium]MCS7273796.1 phosphodiester glycosidase family protein [Candidatus Bipolaricaulota bacterium]MDW8111131.1 phosphodiester glycosidase family protein [Candidatus Bipolaricaulota bacterium]MDW8329755.1 phosphodiester glycosidase family protein [Candidatus Bipolaricaulota bacterium]